MARYPIKGCRGIFIYSFHFHKHLNSLKGRGRTKKIEEYSKAGEKGFPIEDLTWSPSPGPFYTQDIFISLTARGGFL